MRKMRRKIAVLLVFVLAFTMMPQNVLAAKKKVKLSKKSVTITVGKTVKVKLKNNKKKVKWTVTSGKKNVKLSKKKKTSVTIKGKKVGKAKVQVKVGKKKFVCKVTVKKAGTNQNADKNNGKKTAKPTVKPTEKPSLPSTPTPKPTEKPVLPYLPGFLLPVCRLPAQKPLLPKDDRMNLFFPVSVFRSPACHSPARHGFPAAIHTGSAPARRWCNMPGSAVLPASKRHPADAGSGEALSLLLHIPAGSCG